MRFLSFNLCTLSLLLSQKSPSLTHSLLRSMLGGYGWGLFSGGRGVAVLSGYGWFFGIVGVGGCSLVGVGNYNNYGVWTTHRFLFSGGLASESHDGDTPNWG